MSFFEKAEDIEYNFDELRRIGSVPQLARHTIHHNTTSQYVGKYSELPQRAALSSDSILNLIRRCTNQSSAPQPATLERNELPNSQPATSFESNEPPTTNVCPDGPQPATLERNEPPNIDSQPATSFESNEPPTTNVCPDGPQPARPLERGKRDRSPEVSTTAFCDNPKCASELFVAPRRQEIRLWLEGCLAKSNLKKTVVDVPGTLSTDEYTVLGWIRNQAVQKYGTLAGLVGFDDGAKCAIQNEGVTHNMHDGPFGRVVETYFRTLSTFLSLYEGERVEVLTLDTQEHVVFSGIGTVMSQPNLLKELPPRIRYTILDGQRSHKKLFLPSNIHDFVILVIWNR